jgi:hypothetical protein
MPGTILKLLYHNKFTPKCRELYIPPGILSSPRNTGTYILFAIIIDDKNYLYFMVSRI